MAWLQMLHATNGCFPFKQNSNTGAVGFCCCCLRVLSEYMQDPQMPILCEKHKIINILALTLDHELLDNAVEAAALEAKALLTSAQRTEVLRKHPVDRQSRTQTTYELPKKLLEVQGLSK